MGLTEAAGVLRGRVHQRTGIECVRLNRTKTYGYWLLSSPFGAGSANEIYSNRGGVDSEKGLGRSVTAAEGVLDAQYRE
jgi:hypothetical protein